MRWSPPSWMRTPGTAWAFRPARGTVETDASSTIRPESHRGSDIADRAWHDSYVPVVFLITIAAVLVGIFFAATGRGGELSYEHADHAPLDLGPVSAADIALLRPPTAMWGYNMQVTDEALDRIARAMRERDVTIAYLQEQLATLARNGSYAEPRGAHARPPGRREPAGAGSPAVPRGRRDLRCRRRRGFSAAPEARNFLEPESPEALESPSPEAREFPRSRGRRPGVSGGPRGPDVPSSLPAADARGCSRRPGVSRGALDPFRRRGGPPGSRGPDVPGPGAPSAPESPGSPKLPAPRARPHPGAPAASSDPAGP